MKNLLCQAPSVHLTLPFCLDALSVALMFINMTGRSQGMA